MTRRKRRRKWRGGQEGVGRHGGFLKPLFPLLFPSPLPHTLRPAFVPPACCISSQTRLLQTGCQGGLGLQHPLRAWLRIGVNQCVRTGGRTLPPQAHPWGLAGRALTLCRKAPTSSGGRQNEWVRLLPHFQRHFSETCLAGLSPEQLSLHQVTSPHQGAETETSA